MAVDKYKMNFKAVNLFLDPTLVQIPICCTYLHTFCLQDCCILRYVLTLLVSVFDSGVLCLLF